MYMEGGVGLIYTTQHTYEQSTQFNFTSELGGGIYLFLNKNKTTALTVGYRFRHFSNASIKHPNNGVDTHSITAGISFFK